MSTNRKIILFSAVVLLLLSVIGSYEGYRHYCFTRVNLTSTDGESHSYYVYPGTPLDSVLAKIKQDYSIHSEHAFTHDLKKYEVSGTNNLSTQSAHLPEAAVGHYRFPAAIGDRALFRRLIMGEQTPVRLRFGSTIRTNAQLAGRLAQQLLIDSAAIAALLTDDGYLRQFGVNKETARCLFLPDTYEVYWTLTAEQLLERMYRESQRFWTEQRLADARRLHLTTNEVYTLASIVASETTVADEYPVIAGLYLHRLRIGMSLQACPTAVYATGKFGARRITHEMTNHPSPYNTYLHRGLPPGPIRVTPAQVVDSILHAPADSKYLYMCANPDFSRTHIFSETYSKHSAVARQYQRELNKRKIRS